MHRQNRCPHGLSQGAALCSVADCYRRHGVKNSTLHQRGGRINLSQNGYCYSNYYYYYYYYCYCYY